MVEAIIPITVGALVSLIMVGIGISQFRSKEPVGFYTGEIPPKAEELTDVEAWNKKHGIMWLLYGIAIMLSVIVSMFLQDSLWCLVPFGAGVVLPIAVMIWYHHRLIRAYRK